ncbi:MAG: DUF4159 domain-containing protein [Pirellulaceae bacterium]|nr:DUF4159 domain-containing protein [Pirellulaceae bacterium]
MKLAVQVAVMAALAVARVVTPAAAQITDGDVRQAIERGVDYLKSQQDKTRGGWPEHPSQPAGLSALCTLALLNCGVGTEDPAVIRALDYLRKFDKPDMTYSVALRTMALCAAEPKKDLLLIRQNVKWLEVTQLTGASAVRGRKGTWAYSDRQEGQGDNSNTQFALLALNDAQRVGVEVNPSTWRLAQEYWQQTQKPDGSWGYKPGLPSTGSMTCAGIASLVITSGRLSSGRARVEGERVMCCGPGAADDSIERGLLWLGRSFSVRANPGDRSWLLYYLYGLERAGRLTGRRFIGGHDWYREGAEVLVREQDDFSGSWRGVGTAESNPLVATSLALLFLAKGRRPVVIAKAKYGAEGEWDLHAGGVPNLTRHIEQAWLRELTWQTIDLEAASVEDLLEAPVLFLSGRQSLNLTRDQREQLRLYVEQGGFIFAEACDGDGCDGKAFDASFRQLMQDMFPTASLRLLPPDHAVWFAEGSVNPQYLQPLYGIEACCRTSVVYCPTNLSCYWELSAPGRELDVPAQVRDDIQARIQIGQNVVAYATNRVLKEKLDRPSVIAADTGGHESARGVLVIAKLQHDGGSDDAPNALRNLLRYLRQEVELRVLAEQRLVTANSGALLEYPILFVHGRRSFRWNAAERKALADYVANGGFLLADAICASPEFAAAFRREMEAIFPGQKLERIPVNHPLFSNEFGGFDLSRVTLNDPLLREAGQRLDARRTQTAPLLEGLQVQGRYVVVFSPYDLSCALESSASLECKGYLKEDAARIGTNVVLYAMEQ